MDKIRSDLIKLNQNGTEWNKIDQNATSRVNWEKFEWNWIRLNPIGFKWTKIENLNQIGSN